MTEKLRLSDEEWRKRLSAEEYQVLRQHGTEAPWGGCFLGTKTPGTYVCAGCHNPLFKSGEKFESGTGWPSFTKPVSQDSVTEIREDRKSTRLNSSHANISYAVFCLKKKKKMIDM